jgi:hypothetical protein
MLFLSFRDINSRTFSAVTPAEFFDLGPVPSTMAWAPPPLFVEAPNGAATLKGKHVCFLVHGFNVDRDAGYTGLGVLGQELGQTNGALPGWPYPSPPDGPVNLFAAGVDVVVPTLWAGDFFNIPLNYPFLLGAIRLTGRYFAELLVTAQMASVSFVTHSMGARVVLEAVQQALSRTFQPHMPTFDTAVFTAAAVSDQVFDDPDYALAVKAMQQFVVVSSKRDQVLSGAFPLGNAAEEAMWPHDQGEDRALGLTGPKLAPDSPAAGKVKWYPVPSGVGMNHGNYLPRPGNPDNPHYPNGWNAEPVDIGKLAQAVLDDQTPPWPAAVPVPTAPA